MEVEITPEEKENLEKRHKTERDKRLADRIKAVLLCNEGWTQKQISQALRIRPETVHDHLAEYTREAKLNPTNGGSKSHLNASQTELLTKHLEKKVYDKVHDICLYVMTSYNVRYSISGMTKWLHKNGFSYKKPKGTPSKADPGKQEEFVEKYIELSSTLPSNEVIEFADGVHPTMATKITGGWIRRGKDKVISTTASRTRMNLFGSINLSTMSVTINSYDTIDSVALEAHLIALRTKYPCANKIHLVLDRGPYNMSKKTFENAEKHGITLHHLPTYSPNLNPIERLWKLMNEHVRNNKFFDSAKEFRKAVLDFFDQTWNEIKYDMRRRINDNFHPLKQAP